MVCLKWNLPPHTGGAHVTGYDLFFHQERSKAPAKDIKSWNYLQQFSPLQLPMMCTLRNLDKGFKYHFVLRTVYNEESGPFSESVSTMFPPNESN